MWKNTREKEKKKEKKWQYSNNQKNLFVPPRLLRTHVLCRLQWVGHPGGTDVQLPVRRTFPLPAVLLRLRLQSVRALLTHKHSSWDAFLWKRRLPDYLNNKIWLFPSSWWFFLLKWKVTLAFCFLEKTWMFGIFAGSDLEVQLLSSGPALRGLGHAVNQRPAATDLHLFLKGVVELHALRYRLGGYLQTRCSL